MKLNWNKVSKYRNELFGVAAILVILVHSTHYDWCERGIGHILFKIFQQGSIGVDIFLFLAGVGLYYSLKKDSNIRNFMCRRMKRVLIPYLLIAIPGYILYDLVLNHSAVSIFLLDIFLVKLWIYGSNAAWYISFTIVLYLIYPAIYLFILKKRSILKFGILFLLVLAFNMGLFYIAPEFYSRLEIAFARIPIFLLGCWAGEWVYDQKTLTAWIPIGLLGIYVTIRAVLIYSQSMLSYEMYVMIVRVSYVFGALAIVLLLPLIIEKIHLNWIDQTLSWMGGFSLEIYLTHLFLSDIYRSTPVGRQYKSVWVYFVFIIPLSLLIVKGYEKVYQLLKNII